MGRTCTVLSATVASRFAFPEGRVSSLLYFASPRLTPTPCLAFLSVATIVGRSMRPCPGNMAVKPSCYRDGQPCFSLASILERMSVVKQYS